MEGTVHTEGKRGEPKLVMNNTVWLGYPTAYDPTATGTCYKHTVVYHFYLNVDTDIMFGWLGSGTL